LTLAVLVGVNTEMTHALLNTYARSPVSFVRGEGPWLIDADGRRYLDAITGIGVTSLGHAHPELIDALTTQAQTLWLAGNGSRVPEQAALADALCAKAQMDGAFFCNSGVEATECAFKLARLNGHARGIARPQIVVMQNAFHGRTLAGLSATDSVKVQAGYGPLVEGFLRVPFNNIAALEGLIERGDVAAVLLECVQGEGGIVPADRDYLHAVRALCDAHGWLLIADEVQSGFCKTGHWFAYQHFALKPDVVPLAKALGNGYPIGACLARGAAAKLFTPGAHGSTFGGSPLACAVALKVLELLEREDCCARAKRHGERLAQALRAITAQRTDVVAVRQVGLMIGVEFTEPQPTLKDRALAHGVLLNVTRERTLRMLPPLILSDAELDHLIQRLGAILQ
jgi:acetylornithine/N-succinyldiaminopimelate aminotransferase